MTRYLSVPEVVAINAEVVCKFGGVVAALRPRHCGDWLIGLYEAGKVSKANIEPWLREHAKVL